ncbi:hypothetical protein GA0070608_5968 [Micromonospora peucetia]|uniref:TrbL/VirB6 plasmid conjugal transfer protein n=1 Tax=Micromonospora peucetia TaxID=47871 RepID=A0A1C6W554_9ACTN|nr:hypothetical protein GA0070608_5968 [Micromonospora peucetia]
MCSAAASTIEQEHCDAVAVTVQSPPPDGTPSVLDERLPTVGEQPVRCERLDAKAAQDVPNASRWTAKAERCRALRSVLVASSSLKASSECGPLDVSCKVGAQVKEAARTGFEGLADIAVAGFAWALGKLAEVVFTQSSTVVDEPFYGVYNDISGVLIVMVLIVFVISTAINGLRVSGPGPLSSLGGLVRAMFGIAFAGGIAYLLMAAWDEATLALIARNQQREWQPSMWVDALNALTADTGTVLLAFVVAVVGVFGLVVVFVMLVFRSLLAAGAALFGAMAMTGQVMTETRAWGRKWFWTCNALAASKFFIAALWIYGTRTTYESDNVVNVLRGLFIIVLMVLAPWILLRLTSMWDGYLADVDARGFLTSAAGAVGLDAASRRLADPSDGGGDLDAASLMQGNADAIPTIPASPTGPAGALAGLPDEVEALRGRGDSDQFGQPASSTGGEQDAGGENADEAAGVQRDFRTAQGDVTRGQLTMPGDATGEQGALPVTPQEAQKQASASAGSGDDAPGSTGVGGGAAAPSGPSAGSPSLSGSPLSQPADDSETLGRANGEAASQDQAITSGGSGAGVPAGSAPLSSPGGAGVGGGASAPPGVSAGPPSSGGDPLPPEDEGRASGGAAGRSGGQGVAAGGAAEVPIVPV